MNVFTEIKEGVLHLLFPHVCAGCGSDILNEENEICMRCMASLPETKFESFLNNPVENIFRGRLPVDAATSQFYFTKDSVMQELMHELKYKGNKEIGLQLGKIMGQQILTSGRFYVDALVPLPLFPVREKKRGYNQAAVICEGMAAIMKIPVIGNAVIRPTHTETQTKKGRIERWKNMEGKFVVVNGDILKNRHIMLVDDVITTGATLESCGMELLKIPGLTLSIASLCIASR